MANNGGKNDTKIIRILCDKNPRKEGTHGYSSFSVIFDGMTVKQFREAGGRAQDLAWDVAKGHLKLEEPASEAAPEAAPEA